MFFLCKTGYFTILFLHVQFCITLTLYLDGTLCWLAKGALLTILSHSTCKVVSYKNFGNLFPRNSNCRIISCKVFISQKCLLALDILDLFLIQSLV